MSSAPAPTTKQVSRSTHALFLCFEVNFDIALPLVLAGSDFVPRKKGIQGLGSSTNGARNSTADIYQLAQATRMARERHSVVSVGDGMG